MALDERIVAFAQTTLEEGNLDALDKAQRSDVLRKALRTHRVQRKLDSLTFAVVLHGRARLEFVTRLFHEVHEGEDPQCKALCMAIRLGHPKACKDLLWPALKPEHNLDCLKVGVDARDVGTIKRLASRVSVQEIVWLLERHLGSGGIPNISKNDLNVATRLVQYSSDPFAVLDACQQEPKFGRPGFSQALAHVRGQMEYKLLKKELKPMNKSPTSRRKM